MDFEREFLKKHGILKWDEFTELKNDRTSVNEKITKKVITKHELLSQFKVELSLLNECKHKIKDELEKTDDVIDTQILVVLCKRIIDLFDHMHVLFSIEEDLLSYYINFCQENVSYINAGQLDILLDAVLCIRNNKNIWIQLLKLHLKLNSLDKIMNVFQEGVRSLKEDSLPLWKIVIRHLRNKHPNIVRTLLEKGSNIPCENISLEIRPKYLEWCIEFEGIDATRDLFHRLKELQPPCCKLYLIMIAIEREVPDFELDTVRKLYIEVCTLFGENNSEVWLDYIRFEKTHGVSIYGNRICNSAIFRLDTSLVHDFLDEFDEIEREFRGNYSKEPIVIDD